MPLALGVLVIVACAHHPTPLASATAPATAPARGPWWSDAPAARMTLVARQRGVDPDGDAQWLVCVRFFTDRGGETRLFRGGDLAYATSSGRVQWQTRARFGAPCAIVSTDVLGPVTARVHATGLGSLRDARTTMKPRGARVVGEALGPHLMQLGWFPRETRETVSIVRSGPDGRRVVGLVAAPSSTYRDETVRSDRQYRYTVVRHHMRASALVHIPRAVTRSSAPAAHGKGVWLSFSPSLLDPDNYTMLDADAIVEQALRAGLRFIELRTAYGAYWQITPDAKPSVDRLIDLAAKRGIAVIGCTVPREPTFEDLQASVRTALYRTPRGTPFAALGLDLERGTEYLGGGAMGAAALADYPRLVRAALGRDVDILAIVEDPYLNHLTNRDVPYTSIAASSDAIQPMTYWRMLSPPRLTAAETRHIVRSSIETVRRLTRRPLRIVVGGQTVGLAGRKPAAPQELAAAVDESRDAGAAGIAFFEWRGTSEDQWQAIGASNW